MYNSSNSECDKFDKQIEGLFGNQYNNISLGNLLPKVDIVGQQLKGIDVLQKAEAKQAAAKKRAAEAERLRQQQAAAEAERLRQQQAAAEAERLRQQQAAKKTYIDKIKNIINNIVLEDLSLDSITELLDQFDPIITEYIQQKILNETENLKYKKIIDAKIDLIERKILPILDDNNQRIYYNENLINADSNLCQELLSNFGYSMNCNFNDIVQSFISDKSIPKEVKQGLDNILDRYNQKILEQRQKIQTVQKKIEHVKQIVNDIQKTKNIKLLDNIKLLNIMKTILTKFNLDIKSDITSELNKLELVYDIKLFLSYDIKTFFSITHKTIKEYFKEIRNKYDAISKETNQLKKYKLQKIYNREYSILIELIKTLINLTLNFIKDSKDFKSETIYSYNTITEKIFKLIKNSYVEIKDSDNINDKILQNIGQYILPIILLLKYKINFLENSKIEKQIKEEKIIEQMKVYNKASQYMQTITQSFKKLENYDYKILINQQIELLISIKLDNVENITTQHFAIQQNIYKILDEINRIIKKNELIIAQNKTPKKQTELLKLLQENIDNPEIVYEVEEKFKELKTTLETYNKTVLEQEEQNNRISEELKLYITNFLEENVMNTMKGEKFGIIKKSLENKIRQVIEQGQKISISKCNAYTAQLVDIISVDINITNILDKFQASTQIVTQSATNPSVVQNTNSKLLNLNSKITSDKRIDKTIKLLLHRLNSYSVFENKDYIEFCLINSLKKIINSTSNFYDYVVDTSKDKYIWVDFSAKNLTGLTKFSQAKQEEIMVWEHPHMIGLIGADNGNDYVVRTTPNGNEYTYLGVGQGNPTPILIKDVNRYYKNTGIYGNFNDLTLTEVVPTKHDILAMCAPFGGKETVDSLIDFFNTAYVAFLLAKKSNQDSNLTICSGLWGCGAFGGDPRISLFAQMLAAKETDCNIKFYGIEDNSSYNIAYNFIQNCVKENAKYKDVIENYIAYIEYIDKPKKNINFIKKLVETHKLFHTIKDFYVEQEYINDFEVYIKKYDECDYKNIQQIVKDTNSALSEYLNKLLSEIQRYITLYNLKKITPDMQKYALDTTELDKIIEKQNFFIDLKSITEQNIDDIKKNFYFDKIDAAIKKFELEIKNKKEYVDKKKTYIQKLEKLKLDMSKVQLPTTEVDTIIQQQEEFDFSKIDAAIKQFELEIKNKENYLKIVKKIIELYKLKNKIEKTVSQYTDHLASNQEDNLRKYKENIKTADDKLEKYRLYYLPRCNESYLINIGYIDDYKKTMKTIYLLDLQNLERYYNNLQKTINKIFVSTQFMIASFFVQTTYTIDITQLPSIIHLIWMQIPQSGGAVNSSLYHKKYLKYIYKNKNLKHTV